MSNEKKLELTTSDILNVLQHGATREDINDVRQEIIQVRSEITQIRSDLNTKIDTVAKGLDNKIDTVAKDLSNRMDSNFKWTLGIILVGILVPIALHFIK